MANDKTFKLLGIFFLAILAFNFPILNLFGKEKAILGIPVLFAYIFLSWAVVIFFTARIVESKKKSRTQ